MKKLNRLYLGTNTKMYKTIADTASFLTQLRQLTEDLADSPLTLFVIPSFTSLESANRITSRSHIRLGAQNMCWEDQGQFTGEISPVMLKEVGVSVVEIGHSERRHVFRENDFDQEKKTAKAAQSGFTPLLCIGETLIQREYGLSGETLSTQLKVGLHSITTEQAEQLWIAYEPVWAIGVNGIPADSDYVAERHAGIRRILCARFGEEQGSRIPILYGGSVNSQNAQELIQLPDVDGLFIGRSAWDASQFNRIIRQVMPLYMNK